MVIPIRFPFGQHLRSMSGRRARMRARRNPLLVLFLLAVTCLFSSAQPALAINAPDPLTPGDGSNTTVLSDPPLAIPQFTWSPVGGASSYRVQWSSDIGFATIPFEVTTPNTTYTPPSAGPFSDGTWYWRVRVDAPTVSNYSLTFSFSKQWAAGNAPALTAPADGATIDFYDQPIFSWQPVMGAARYRFQIATDPAGFNSPTYEATVLPTTHQPSNKLANGTYYWRVVPRDPFDRAGTPSVVRSFSVFYNQVPTLLEPLNNTFPTYTPTFRWTAMRGAQTYRLQYSSDPTFPPGLTQIDTPNTTFTPNSTLPNDVNIFWRVRVLSGLSVSQDWSAVYIFVKRWYLQPTLLTPPNNEQLVSEPFFQWSPVPGAASYRIEVNSSNCFPPGVCGLLISDITDNPFYVKPDFAWESFRWQLYPSLYWRVTPIDGGGNVGKPSLVSSFNASLPVLAPRQIWPLYYYPPTSTLHPHEDRTVALPIFEWHRMVSTTSQTNAYRIQVSPSPVFANNNWTFDTQNLNAVPTAANPFTPSVDTDYYWHVSQLDSVGGNLIGLWSQRWTTRIDTTKGLTPTVGAAPTLLRPFHGSESVETTPLFEWFPLQGANSYDIQISDDPNFGTYIVPTTTVPYPAFSPETRLGYGTYYWRARGRSGGVPFGNFSAPWRFQVAAQSHWQATRNAGESGNRSQIGADAPADMTDPNYDLSTLYVTQSKDFWHFGFNVSGTVPVTYVLYLDLDHIDNSGAMTDTYKLNVYTIAAHRPEYAIYIQRTNGTFSATNTYIWRWNGSDWDFPFARLSDINATIPNGGLFYSSTINYLEIQVPNTAIGMEERTGSAAISLFSVMASGGHAQDTVPSDPNVAYTAPDGGGATTTLSRFTSVSERLTLTLPPSNTSGDPTEFSSLLPFFWNLPVNASWAGYNLQLHLDPQYTSLVRDFNVCGRPIPALTPPDYTYNPTEVGDNTYYWRVRPVYICGVTGAWSQAVAFDRRGFIAQNLTTSVTFATPTFSWDMVEGAETYELQVDNDPGFGSPEVGVTTARKSHTPIFTLNPGIYYWRVRVHRPGGVTNEWSPAETLNLVLPQPTGLATLPPGVVGRAPTYCWNSLVVSANSIPVLAAWKYRIQVSKNDPTFSSIYDQVDTEQDCWTPTHGYDDGTYFWRVAMIDGQGKAGNYTSPAQTVTKQYPVTTLVSPATGSGVAFTPTFVWTSVNGAASYKLDVSTSPTFSPLYDTVASNNIRYTPARTYANQTYYWRVAIVDADGKLGPYNTATLILGPNANAVFLPLIKR